ncbi:hypothetical protein B5S30_g5066 [[Candida] boidinii]|nr:hypothetical protein B5S30_g5066 [[Candida] boidinii]
MVEMATGANNGGANVGGTRNGDFNSGNRIKRTLSAVPSLYGKYKDSKGFIFRKKLRKIEDKISPIVRTLIPNFLVAHYVYVVGMAILGSIIMYPIRNIPYVDCLFLAGSSVTQAGLATLDINTLYLYQQLVIYLICLLTGTPFIHTILVWFRLYWFEQYFDDIKEKSKLNFEMRRNATMLSHGTNNNDDQISTASKLFRTMSKGLFGKNSSSGGNGVGTSNNEESDSVAIEMDDENSYNSADYLEKKTEQVIGFSELPKPQHARHKTIVDIDDESKNKESLLNANTNLDKNRQNRKLKKLRKLHKANKRQKLNADADANPNEVVSSDSEDEENEIGSLDSQMEEQDANGRFYNSQYKQQQYQQGKPNYLSWTPTIARNSNFVIMNREQREELGGVEYRALKLLSILLPVYYFGLHIIQVILLLPYIVRTPEYVAVTREVGVSPSWWAIFNAMSSINNCGLSLTPTSLIPFNGSMYVGIVTSFFIAVGNTAFPMFLRLIIWLMYKTSKPMTLYRESLQFLLDHPRRCFTYLFPSSTTWWLTGVWFLLNGVDWILFLAMDFHSSAVVDISPGFRAFDGLFQSITARTAGFGYFNLSLVTPALQLSYVILMYISIVPTALAIRGTNVYEDQSLGIYDGDDRKRKSAVSSRFSFVNYYLGEQLSFDLWFVVLMVFIICICERKGLRAGDANFTIFAITFEVVSAYGTVGLSLGYPTFNSSLSTRFTVLSKLVVILTMIRGKHRGLPYTVDRSIMLQGIDVEARDQIEALLAIRGSDNSGLLHEEAKMTQDLIKDLNEQIHDENGGSANSNHPSSSASSTGGYIAKIFKYTKSLFSSMLIINVTNNRNNPKDNNLELQRELTQLAPRQNK